jgi:DNA ligase (NAD+)
MLELSVGDTAAVSKRGDVIPAVEKVLDKNPEGTPVWKMPETCPSCGHKLTVRGAHTFCVNPDCPAQVRGRIFFFIGRGQMDIDSFGPETAALLIDKGVLRDIPDIYTIDYEAVLGDEPGFGPKKIENIRKGVEKSRQQPYHVVLPALGIPDIGKKAAELLIDAGYRDIDSLIELAQTDDAAERLTEIAGFGLKTAQSIVQALRDEAVLARIDALRQAGLNFREEAEGGASAENDEIPNADAFAGQVWCVTGSFDHFKPRSLAMEEVKKRGERIVTQVTGKTTHLLAGEGAGSKLRKAEETGTEVVSEDEFLAMCGIHV